MQQPQESIAESIGRRATRTLSALLVGKVAGLVITTLTFIIAARLLGPSVYGLYTLAIGYASLLSSMSQFGVSSYFNKYLSEYSYKKDEEGIMRTIANGYVVLVPIAAILTIIGLLLSSYVAYDYLHATNIQSITLMLAAAGVFFYMIWGGSYTALVGFGKGGAASITLLALNTTQLILEVLLIKLGYGVNGAVVGILIGDIIGFLATTYLIYKAVKKHVKSTPFVFPKFSEIKRTLAFSVPLALNNLFNAGITNLAILVLGTYVITGVLGNYGTANQGAAIMILIYGTITTVLIQYFSTTIVMQKDKKKIALSYNKALLSTLVITLPMILFLGVFAQPIITLILPQFTSAPQYLLLIAIGTTLDVVGIYASTFIMASGEVNLVLKYSFITVVIQIVALFLLVPMYLVLGAIAAVFYIGNIVSTYLFMNCLENTYHIKQDVNKIVMLFVGNIILMVAASAALLVSNSILSLIAGIIIAVLLYPPILVLLGIIDGGLMTDLKSLSQKIPVLEQATEYFAAYTNVFMMMKHTDTKGDR